MNVFILSTGRCGSTTISRAFGHATNYTSGHETRATRVQARLEYPDQHIESDNRLVWFLGPLEQQYRDDVYWVHLTREFDHVVDSFHARWEQQIAARAPKLLRHPLATLRAFRDWQTDTTFVRRSIAVAFAYGIVMPTHSLDTDERRAAVELYVQTTNDNIERFLRDRPNVTHISLEDPHEGFRSVWEAIDARGPLEQALDEFSVRHNAR